MCVKYSERLAEAGIEPSVGSVGDSYDNALAETINGLYKTEVIHRRGPWRGLEAVEFATLEWVDWFNNRRMLKQDGLRLDAAQTGDPHRLMNLAALAALATGAAVRLIQLVDARDGSTRPASDVATPGQITAAAALGPALKGRTRPQQNPHPPGSLAWLSWIIARLGGWNCYGRSPGPKTMRTGWDRFATTAAGYALAQDAAHGATHDA